MKEIIILTSVSEESSELLAEGINTRSFGELKATVCKPFDGDRPILKENSFIFGYGCSFKTRHKKAHRLNKGEPVATCVDKIKTFKILHEAKIPTVKYATSILDIPPTWEWIVARKTSKGRKAEDIEYLTHEELPKFADWELFSEYFEHRYEYRIMVFNGQVVGRYYKALNNDDWDFNIQPRQGFEAMDKACLKAAKVLGIDFVGFDVVANNKKDFRILEANSGPMLTDEAEDAIIEYYLNLK